MNIVFIEKSLRADKLGIMYLAAVMRMDGHAVNLLVDDRDNIDEYFSNNKVDVVCWSMMSVESEWMFKKNEELKKKFQFISIIGGNHPTFFPEDVVKNEYVDYVVIGPGELVINKILKKEFLTKTVRGSVPDTNKTPHPYRELQYKYDEFGKSNMKRFIAGRNCYYNCSYCFNHAYKKIFKDDQKMMFKWKSVDLMLEEISYVKDNFGLKLIYFNDDDIAANKEWILEFCNKIEKFKLNWCGSVRACSVDFDILKTMADSGCNFLNMALESANRDTQKLIRREWNSNEKVQDGIENCKKVGIKTRLQNMIGLPVDDPLQDAFDTLIFNQKVQPTDSWVSMFQPYRGTQLWEYCKNKNLINPNSNGGTFYEGSVLNIPNVEQINSLYKWWPYLVKYNIPMELIKILIDIPLSPAIQKRLQDYRWEDGRKLLYGF